jgi:hypothetical protein
VVGFSFGNVTGDNFFLVFIYLGSLITKYAQRQHLSTPQGIAFKNKSPLRAARSAGAPQIQAGISELSGQYEPLA